MPALIKLFSGTNTQYLAKKIADSYGQELGDLSISRFSDGEFQACYEESVRGCKIFLIQSTFAPTDNLFELLMMIDAARRASADYITVVIPYFGFARQDRKDKPRVSIASKLIANLLSASGVNRIMTMDLHAAQIQGFFDKPVDHLDSSVIFVPYVNSLGLDNLVFGAPDIGSSRRAREFAKHFSADIVICDKQRKRANEIESMTIIGDVEGKDVVLVDDIVDTAGTITKAADLMIENGATSVRAVCTHPVLSGKAYENINNSKLVELVVCDTIPINREKSSKIKVVTVGDIFAKAIRIVHEYDSISSLFNMSNHFKTPIKFVEA